MCVSRTSHANGRRRRFHFRWATTRAGPIGTGVDEPPADGMFFVVLSGDLDAIGLRATDGNKMLATSGLHSVAVPSSGPVEAQFRAISIQWQYPMALLTDARRTPQAAD